MRVWQNSSEFHFFALLNKNYHELILTRGEDVILSFGRVANSEQFW